MSTLQFVVLLTVDLAILLPLLWFARGIYLALHCPADCNATAFPSRQESLEAALDADHEGQLTDDPVPCPRHGWHVPLRGRGWLSACLIALLGASAAQAQAPAIYRMAGLGIDTTAERMALHPASLPGEMPVVGRVLSGTVRIDGSRVEVITYAIPPNGAVAQYDTTRGTIDANQVGAVRHITVDGKAHSDGFFLHVVNGQLYLLPGKRVRIALGR